MSARLGSRFECEELELDMTPMIDIVFNLLIFFMCATKLRVPEGVIEAFLPKDKGGLGGTPTQVEEVRIKLLWVERSGRPSQDPARGFVVLKVGEQALNSPSDWASVKHPELHPAWGALGEVLKKLKAAHRAGPEGKGLPVIIDARKQVPTKFVIRALDQVVDLGIKDVTFAGPARGS